MNGSNMNLNERNVQTWLTRQTMFPKKLTITTEDHLFSNPRLEAMLMGPKIAI